MNKFFFFTVLIVFLLIFSSCSNLNENNIDYQTVKLVESNFFIDENFELSDNVIRIHNGKIGPDRRYGFIDYNGKIIVEPKYLNGFIFSEGLSFVIDEKSNGIYIDNLGNLIIETADNYDISLGDIFKNGYAKVISHSKELNEDFALIIDVQGDVILSEEMLKKNISNIGNGYFEITNPSDYNEKKIVDYTGAEITDDGFSLVYPDKNANGFYTKDYNIWGVFYNKETRAANIKKFTSPENGYSIVETTEGEVWILKLSDMSYINLSQKYESIDTTFLNRLSGGYFGLNFSNGKKAVILNTSGELIANTECELIFDFDKGVAKYSKDGKYGIVSNNGNIVVDAKMDSIININDGVALVKTNNAWSLIILSQRDMN